MALLIYCLLWIMFAMSKGAIEDHLMENDSCRMFDSCEMSEHFRSCSCDDSCFEFGTCCKNTSGASAMTQDNLKYWCNREGTETPVFAKRTCASNFTDDERVVAACLSGGRTGGDLIDNVMVSSNATQRTYWNWNCAICNHEEAKNLAYWKVHVLCPSTHRDRDIERDLVKENLVYREQNQAWGLDLDGEFVNCNLMFSEPRSVRRRLKYCAPNLMDTCPHDYHDEVVKKKCASNYYGERKDRNSQRHFKNVHCAICNGLGIEDLSCFAGTYNRVSHGATPDTIKVTFESDHWEKKIGKMGEDREVDPDWKNIESFRFGSNMVYNPFQNRCRNPGKSDWNVHNSASIDRLAIFSIILSLLLICVRNKLT